jgi:cellulose synthase/poly-beta-1,6-N-acetylglucosamine synthase-like glycosyltransferase/peptidoglycan/xylan/chitin deacetylase (PgdA/CDA1 family)/spore germination protein YaaH
MQRQGHRPVFFDPSARRWKQVWRITLVLLVAVSVLLGTVLIAVSIRPGLPQLALESSKERSVHAKGPRATVAVREARFAAARKALEQNLKRSLPPVPAVAKGKFERIAFFVNWDDNSWVSLKRNIGNLDVLMAEWLHLSDAAGHVSVDDPYRQQTVMQYVQANRAGLPIMALINNFHDDRWDSERLKTMLADPAARERNIDAIIGFVQHWQLAGVNIDYEAVSPESQSDLVIYMRELYARLHPLNLLLSQSVPLDDEAFHFKLLAEQADYLVLMAYDEHAGDNDAGPIASQEWFVSNIKRRMREVPADKLVVGIGSYGYDWLHGRKKATELSFQEALTYAEDADEPLELDEASGNPGFTYTDEHDAQHDVWFLDAVTAFNQVKAASRLSPRGYALWRLGSEDPAIWTVLNKPAALDQSIGQQLETLNFGYDLDYRGKGEILRVVGTPESGQRKVNYDPDIGLLTDDEIEKFPRGYVIQRWGFDGTHAIALTFDDGPDAQYTEQILDILRDKQVHASFFVIGENAQSNPALIDRIYAEGHEIGNHTFTHPNIADVSEQRTVLELNATERFLESRLGRRSLLFRPPYAEDVEPETPDQVRPLVLTSSLGYYSVGMQIDPDDWKRPPPDEIIKRVLEQADSGAGNVVLLHDAGGDRTATVAALPQLIDTLRAHGYHLVTISQLLKVPRDAVMPVVHESFNVWIWLENQGFSLINEIGWLLRTLFIIGIAMGIARFVIIGTLAACRGLGRRTQRDLQPSLVSIIVPAYNEERLVVRTVETLLASQGVTFEIIVVDDGSTDNTAAAIEQRFANDPRVRLLKQANAGKAEALNAGIRIAHEDIIVALDADTLFTEQTVARLAAHFVDPKIGAVAGNAKVGNRINLLTRWQALEYVTAQNLDRRAFELLNCITVVPGAVGAWRRSAVTAAGGFLGDTLAEDADLTMRIVRHGYRVVYEQRAMAYTEAPQTFGAFVKQRFRWMYGTLQACWKHRDILLRRKGGALGCIALPNVILFQIAFPLVSPVMDFTMLWTTLEAVLNYFQHPDNGLSSGFWHTLFYYGVFLGLDICTALIAYLFEPDEDWRLLLWLPLQRFCYRQLMYYVANRSFLAALRGPYVGWGRVQRYGSVRTDPTNT